MKSLSIREVVDMRAIKYIAEDIKLEWKKVNFAAAPYLDAMLSLSTTKDDYGADDGESVVLYFLSNASTFRGEAARRLKKELKEHLS